MTTTESPPTLYLQPLDDRLVVRPEKAPEKTGTGLYLPQQSQERPQRGTVLAVGPGRYSESGVLIPMLPRVGDTVLYSKYGGSEISVDGEDVLILSSRDVLAMWVG